MSTSSIFTGGSRYSSDFSSVIDRAVSIAALPLQQLENGKTTLGEKSAAVGKFQNLFTGLRNAVSSLQSAGGLSSYTSSISDGSIVKATVGEGALEGSYSVEVTSLGSFSNTMSSDGLTTVSSPSTQNISSASSFTLTVNGVATVITPAENTLNSMVQAIKDSDAGVLATIVNIGSSSSPDYRLSLQSETLGADSIQLSDGTPLLNTLSTGSKAAYKVNGLTTPIESTSRTVTLAPGLTVDLLKESTPGSSATISVSRSNSSTKNALSAFTTAYNAVVNELNTHRGKNAGALAGESVLQTLDEALRSMTSHSSSGSIGFLSDLGLNFDDQGKLSLDSVAFSSANFDSLQEFLGDGTGSGFLAAANNVLDGLIDAQEGALSSTAESLTTQIRKQDEAIAAAEERLDLVRETMTAKINAADALIANLEQQVLYITNLFKSMQGSDD